MINGNIESFDVSSKLFTHTKISLKHDVESPRPSSLTVERQPGDATARVAYRLSEHAGPVNTDDVVCKHKSI